MDDEPRARQSRLGVRLWPRGLRGRLVAVYLLAAAVVTAAGSWVLLDSLDRGLRANVDAGLHARADGVVSGVQAGNIEQADPPPRPGVVTALTDFVVVIDSAKMVVESQPSPVPPSVSTFATGSAARAVTTQYLGRQFRILVIPVATPGGAPWHVVAGQNLDTANEALYEIRRAVYVAVPVLLFLVGLGAWLLSGSALRPVERMRADVERISADVQSGATARRGITEPGTRDGLARLGRTFNDLLHRLSQSLQHQRDFVADAGHELRTPLAVLRAELETATRPGRTRADLLDSIEHAHDEVRRLSNLADDLLLLAQNDATQVLVLPELSDLSTVIGDAVSAHRASAEAAGVHLVASAPQPLLLEIDPSAIRRVLDNLISNAIRHTPAEGRIVVSADVDDVTGPRPRAVRAPRPTESVRLACIRVLDTGCGFPDDFLPRAFDRFSRADQGHSPARGLGGTGLGLAVVQSLVTAHRGTVTVANSADGGALVVVRLPVEAAAQ